MSAVSRAASTRRRGSDLHRRPRLLLAAAAALVTTIGVITVVDGPTATAGVSFHALGAAPATVRHAATVAAATVAPTVSLTSLAPSRAVGAYRLNRSISGRRLQLDGTRYTHGIGVRAYSRLTYNLGGRYTSLTVRLGIDDEVGRGGSAVFLVYVDGKRMYSSPVLRGSSRARTVALRLTGARTLTLQVTSPGASRTLHHADWVSPTLVRVKPTGSAPPVPSPNPPPISPNPSTTSPSVNCTTAVWQNLDSCGWAGPATTGYTSSSLRITSPRTVTVDGTVIDGERISGGLVIAAKGVVVRNSWISNSAGGVNASAVVDVVPGASLTIEHSTLDGQNATHACLWFEGTGGVTARYNEMYGCNDGIFSWDGDNFTLESNYLHSFTTQAANGHIDGFQTEGAVNGVIRHNTIDVEQDQNSAVAIWNDRRSSNNILVDSNLLSGGGFTVYAEDYSPSEASPAGGYSVTNITISNNRFSTVHYGCVGYWGVWFPRGAPTDGWKRSGNKVLETGQSVDSGNPTYQGTTCN